MAKLKIQSDVKPFTIIKNTIIDCENILNEHEKILYIVLLRYGNKAFPSLATLSKKCGFSKRTAQRTIDTLIEKGLLKKKNRINKNNGNTSNIYTLLDNDKIWHSSKENLKENIETAILEEAIKIIEASGRTISNKEKELVSEPSKAHTQALNNNNFDTNKNTTNKPKSQAERYTIQDIRMLYEYDSLIIQYPKKKTDIDVVFDILYDTLNSTKQYIRVGGEDKPAMAVIGKLMKLDYSDISYSINKYHEQTERIKNVKSYLLTILYNSKEQQHLDIMNLGHVNHDF